MSIIINIIVVVVDDNLLLLLDVSFDEFAREEENENLFIYFDVGGVA